MPVPQQKGLSYSDWLSLAGIAMGVAGVTGPQFLPSRLLEMVPEPIRIVISVMSGIVGLSALLFLLYQIGRFHRWARITLYGVILLSILGLDLLLFNSFPTWLRALIGAVSGATVLVFTQKAFSPTAALDTKQAQTGPKSDEKSAMFEVTNNAQVDVTGLYVTGSPTRIARADNAQFKMTNTTIVGPDSSPISLPPPDEIYKTMSNSELRTLANSLESRLRLLQASSDATSNIGVLNLPNATREQRLEKFRLDNEKTLAKLEADEFMFKHEILPLLRNIVSAIVVRTGPLMLPPLSMDGGIEVYRQRRFIVHGSTSISSGRMGGVPQSVADFLRYVVNMLPP